MSNLVVWLTIIVLLLPAGSLLAQAQQPATQPASQPASQPAAVPCQPGRVCPDFAELVRQLSVPEQGADAARLLAHLRDPRAVLPLALSAVYGVTDEVKSSAATALSALVTYPTARVVAHRVARTDVDPAIRQALARALGTTAAAEVAPQPLPAKAAPPSRLTDPDPTRVVYGPTAFGRRANTYNWTIYNVGYWIFDYGINDHVEIGMNTIPPVGLLAFMPHIKLSTRINEMAAVGLYLAGGVFYPYVENDDEFRAGIYGGGPMLTIGSPDLLLNVGLSVYGVTVAGIEREWISAPGGPGYETSGTKYEHNWSITPNVGFGWRLAKRIKLNAELFVPVIDHEQSGKIWVLLYGLRFFGERIYGDVNFVLPFFEDMWEIMKYAPIGFPLLTFGLQW
jgi:hypothetical protein